MTVWTRNRVDVDVDQPGIAVVTLRGEHETYEALAIERRLRALTRRGRALVVDLSAATFIDSAVLGALLRARTSAEQAGTTLLLVVDGAGDPAIPRIFEITGLLRAFRTAPTREAAVDAARMTYTPA